MKQLLLVFLVMISACSGSKYVKPANLQIQPRSSWNAAAPKPYKQQTPLRITIHHEGTYLAPNANSAEKIHNIQAWGMGPDRGWADIPYHFLIAPDGTIYEGRAPTSVGETATEYNPEGHLLVTCLGNLEEQPVEKAQLRALIRLLAKQARQYNIPVDSIAGHKDFSTHTDCPGKNLYVYIQNGFIKREVKKLLK